MITVLIRRIVPLVALAAVLALLLRMQQFPEVGNDAFLHLRLGEEFRSGWSISHPGHLSVFDTGRWYPSQWLSQLAMAWTDDTFGMGGVLWLAGAFILALPLAMYVVCRQRAAPLPAALASVLGTCAAIPGLSARPQIVSYLLILVVTAAWLATAHDQRPRYWLVLLAWVWVPIHGMWVVGISIGLASVIGIALTRSCDVRTLARLASIPVLSGLVPMLTPLGIHAYSTVVGVSDRNAQLTEWAPADFFSSPNAIVLMAMIAVILVTALRNSPVEWPTIMLFGLGIAWGLFSLRTTFVAAIILAPLLALALQQIVPAVEPVRRNERITLASMGLVALIALGFVTASEQDERPVAPWVDDRLDAMPAGTKVLNDWALGHYTLWRHPQLQLVMHGYVDVFSVEELERNIEIANLAPGWDVKVERLDVTYAIVEPDSPLGYGLTDLLNWTVVESDEDYELLVPPSN